MPAVRKLANYLDENPKLLYIACLLLVLPALLINLGIMPLQADEKYRALVAIELRLTDNWWVPTINGDYYYNKPPIFNWMVNGLYAIFGESEFTLRLATIIPLLGFAATLFVIVKKHFNTKIAFLTAFALITMNRFLFYDTLLGLIDTLFSWLTFLQLYFIVIYYQRKDYKRLYLYSYILMGVGTLLKGLPSIAFQGMSLLTIFLYHRNIKGLFSIWNFIGLPIAVAIPAAYFWKYNQYNDAMAFLTNLFFESSKRFESEWWQPIAHFFIFPFKGLIGQIFPWAILVIVLFKNHLFKTIKGQPVLFYLLLLLLTNIIPYWISPENRPRYLFMFYPIILLLFIYLYETADPLSRRKQLTNMVLFSFSAVLAVGFLVPLFVEHAYLQYIDYLPLKAIGFFVALGLLAWLIGRLKQQKLIVVTLYMLVCRLAFDVMVLPVRGETEPVCQTRDDLIPIVEMTQGKPLYLHHLTPLDEMQSYYITKGRGELLTRKEFIEPGNYYIMPYYIAAIFRMKVLYQFHTHFIPDPLALAFLPEEDE